MTINHSRKKQPELVKAALIDSVRTLAVSNGLSSVSIQAICDMAGVTKGAFFHHFSGKDALIECVFKMMIDDFSNEISKLMRRDPYEKGAFTRAYLEMGISTIGSQDMMTLWKSAMADEHICQEWSKWYLGILNERQDFEDKPELVTVRLAIDGLCLGINMQIIPRDLDTIISTLRHMCSGENIL